MLAAPDPADPLRWTVTSASRPEIAHTVDIGRFSGIGECSCEHFQFRIAPELRLGTRRGAMRCRHILVARDAFADAMIATIQEARRLAAIARLQARQPEPEPDYATAW